MFRAQNSQLDNAVAKATDENLTSEPWGLILDVCDQVGANPSGPQLAVAALIKRLAHRNANVQIYTLELANALSQNCGPDLHRELASKAFTEALLRLASDRNTHAQVKQKVIERMGTWTELFSGRPELGIMEQAYQKLRLQQPGLMPPSKPAKQEVSPEERRKEEEELQMALALSIKDKGAAAGADAAASGGQQANGAGREEGGGEAREQGTTAATVSRVRALYDFTPSEAGELAFRKGDVIAVLESVYKDWWKGSLRGNTGIFPLNYVEKLQDPTKEELERDAHMESEVFGEIKSVEKLLALLSVRSEGGGARKGEREEEEISELYQRTLSIRPKLIELIGKYSQKKDDFTSLNEKFIKARRDYEALLESSMSQPQYQQQQYPIRQRPSAQQMYPPLQQQQQPPYSGPPQSAQGYPPQQHYAQQNQPPYTQQPQQHLPPQQDVQRFYSPSPSEPPSHHQQQPPQSYASPYPNLSSPHPPSIQPSSGPAPFHFIPGGLQSAPPPQQQQPQPHPPQQQPQQEIRRKPSPQAPVSAGPSLGPEDPYGVQRVDPSVAGFQGVGRPNSIHTLNSGNPQELGTGGYESPVDNRHSYPPAGAQQQQGGYAVHQSQQQQHAPPLGVAVYDGYPGAQQQHQQQPQHTQPPPPQQQQPYPTQAPAPPRSDRDTLPSRQRTQSFESPTSVYSAHNTHQQQQQPESAGVSAAPWSSQVSLPPQPSGPPPGVPGSGVSGGAPYQQQAYQAYQPPAPSQQQQQVPGQQGGDPGDYYR